MLWPIVINFYNLLKTNVHFQIPEIRESTNELIKENLAESILVSILQACGILFGTTFMYFMSRVNSVDF